ncbi:MAG: hypothetical protein HUJ90_02955, partial [Bacteroidales bacterium]|nr:hypothetical protein [Bacteroidales bacterium]
MNKLHFILMLLCASLLLTGCDTIRSMLGKPTSADIEQMRIEQLAAERAARDSVAVAQRTAEEAPVLQQPESDLKYRYYVVLGSFKTSG